MTSADHSSTIEELVTLSESSAARTRRPQTTGWSKLVGAFHYEACAPGNHCLWNAQRHARLTQAGLWGSFEDGGVPHGNGASRPPGSRAPAQSRDPFN